MRTVDFSGELKDETVSDENGKFKFPVIFKRSILNVLPQEFAAGQEIVVYYEGQQHRIWSGVKREPDENAESGGGPLIVTCELASESKLVEVGENIVLTQCLWNVDQK